MQHTYTLAALYPYATQMTPGEWAFQAEVGYNFKRKTALGGRYGTNVKVNFSHVRGIDQETDATHTTEPGGNGAKSKFFKMGPETYYQDINVQIDKKVSRQLKLNFMYAHQRYNQKIVEGHGSDAIKSHIFVAEGKYQFSPKITLRGEAQYLHTKQDQGDWWFGLLETFDSAELYVYHQRPVQCQRADLCSRWFGRSEQGYEPCALPHGFGYLYAQGTPLAAELW